MRILWLTAIAALILAGGLMLISTPVSADSELPDIGAHRHFITNPSGKTVEVGPNVCDNPTVQNAFNQFHSNVHHAVPDSQGPPVSAPGLHNSKGGELLAGPC